MENSVTKPMIQVGWLTTTQPSGYRIAAGIVIGGLGLGGVRSDEVDPTAYEIPPLLWDQKVS